jgi:hypothetical protein
MLSEKAKQVKTDLEQIKHIDRQIENLQEAVVRNQEPHYGGSGGMHITGGSLNKTEDALVGKSDREIELLDKIIELKNRQAEIERKLNLLQLLEPKQYNLVYDRYLRHRPLTLEQIALKKENSYNDRSNMWRVYNQIFERLAWL